MIRRMIRRSALGAMIGGMVLLVSSPGVFAVDPCTEGCAQIIVGSGTGAPNRTVTIPVSFEQGPDDGAPGQGNDEVAALAFTLGIPGTGNGAPLVLECVDSNGDGDPDTLASDAVVAGEAIADAFAVVVENAECTNRNRCLCPGDGQTRDDFINIVVYGPKDLPEEGPVNIPILPESGQLLSINLGIVSGTPEGIIPLHVFFETDDGAPEKPQFAAFLSIGDQAAIDQTADRVADRSKVAFQDGQVEVGPPTGCVGDCDGNGEVTVDELLTLVNIGLGNQPASACPAGDANGNGEISVDEIVTAVGNALSGCAQ